MIICFLIFCSCLNKQPSNEKTDVHTVEFPQVTDPIQLVDNGKEHLYASYVGINSFSQNDKYVTVLETDVRHRLPTEKDPATLGLVNRETFEFMSVVYNRPLSRDG